MITCENNRAVGDKYYHKYYTTGRLLFEGLSDWVARALFSQLFSSVLFHQSPSHTKRSQTATSSPRRQKKKSGSGGRWGSLELEMFNLKTEVISKAQMRVIIHMHNNSVIQMPL